MKPTHEQHSLTLADIEERTRNLDLEAFRQQFGEAFLTYSGREEELNPPKRDWYHTMQPGGRVAGGSAAGVFAATRVFQVRSTGKTMSPLFIAVGRVEGSSDVVITDETVSALHAVFERGPNGEFLLRDMGSRNGTFINSEPVSNESPEEVLTGDNIRFGSVSMVFLRAEELFTLARHLVPARR